MAANSGGRGARTPAGGSGSRGPLLPTAPAVLAQGLGPGCLVTPRVRRECLRALSCESPRSPIRAVGGPAGGPAHPP